MLKSTTVYAVLAGLLLLAALLFVAQPQSAWAQAGPPPEDDTAQLFQPEMTVPPFNAGFVLVGVRGDVAAAASAWEGIEVLGVEPLELRPSEVVAAKSDGAPPMSGYKLTVPVGTEWDAIATLAARSEVVFAEPDWSVQIAQSNVAEAAAEIPFAVADTLYHEQWYIQRIGASRAWALALEESGGDLETVEVAVIDTGVDFSHPDLAGLLASGNNYIDGTATAYDDNGHGTHISGLIAGALNGAGMVGTGLAVEIIPLKVLGAKGTGFVSNIVPAVYDAADQGVDIINMSLELFEDSVPLRTAVQYAVNRGVLVIAASGNYARLVVSYPAAYPSVMAVGATTYFDARAYYSNQGADLDLMAPGGAAGHSILSTWTRYSGAVCAKRDSLRQIDGGIYCEADGTSMATGVASGVAALIMSLRPDLDADEVQAILLNSAAPIVGTSEQVGRGRLDAVQAVRMVLEPRLISAENAATVAAAMGADPFTVTLSLENPALAPLNIEMTPTISTTWYALVGPREGETSYGAPLDVQLVFTPTAAATGVTQSSIRITTTTESGGTTIYFIPTRLTLIPVTAGDEQLYLPAASAWPDGFSWAEPAYTARTNYAIGSDGNIVVDLPFTMTVGGYSYTDIRIFGDGFLVASGSAFPANLPNECLANQTWPSYAVYGWWSNLSVGTGSQLSTFQPDAGRFVVEYDRFVSLGSSDPDDRVTFQIVLHKNGQVALNYARTPEHLPSSLTVGATVEDGRFYNQVTCHLAGSLQIGEAPRAYQSFFFNTGDLY